MNLSKIQITHLLHLQSDFFFDSGTLSDGVHLDLNKIHNHSEFFTVHRNQLNKFTESNKII